MLAGTLAGCCTVLAAQDGPGDQDVGRTTEREVKVVISCAFGHLKVCRGEPEKIVVAETGGNDSAPMHLSYTVRNRIGYLDVTLGEPSDGEKKHGVFRVQNIEAGTWTLRFGDAIPISFDIEQGVGKGEYDLSGLQVKDFTLNNGASDVVLMFDEPNRSVIENLSIESGVSKFSGVHLGNANFKRFRFQGGVGSSTLDFSGALRREVDVDIELAFGALSILVPQETGARVFYNEGWMSSIDYDRDFTKAGDSEYTSDNYATARGRMNISIETRLGRIKLRRP
jgi:hypothetical protein